MRRERFDKMNVVPFIDIVLVLLVIVLATASFVNNKTIKIDLPSASSKKQDDKKNIIIAIDENGKYFYAQNEMSLEDIKTKLSKLDVKKDSVSLHTDKKTDFSFFVNIIDFMKEKGFKNISIVTKQ